MWLPAGPAPEGKTTMDFGINVATAADSFKVVKRAEELDYARARFYDTQMLNADVFVAMAAAAVHTSKIRLATGVLIPSNRIAPVTASALASLNALAPGRVDFGISTGFTARRAMGLGPVKLACSRGAGWTPIGGRAEVLRTDVPSTRPFVPSTLSGARRRFRRACSSKA